MRLQGKRCVVTGAAQGIGQAITERFLSEAAEVVAVDRSCELIRPRDRLAIAQIDITDEDTIAAWVQELPAIDVLVNCVGTVPHGTLLEGGLNALDEAYRVNVRSMAAMMIALLPDMLARGRGSIVNIASAVSSLKAAPQRCAYAASKGAVIALTKSVAMDYIRQGIRCNAISPGTIDTPSLQQRMSGAADPEAARAAFITRQPMGRLGFPEEIAAAAVFAASDEAAFMTGENIVVDGGMTL